MNTATYQKLRSRTWTCEDEHFACMKEWLTSRKDPAVAKACLPKALKYKKALEAELAYLNTRPQSAEVIKRIEKATEFLEIVARDVSYLSGH